MYLFNNFFPTFPCREPFTPGETSKEKEIQDNREKNVLSVIYFSKEATPTTPHEAEQDTASMKSNQPAFIPLEDSEADENSEFNHSNKGWIEPKENKVSQQAQIESQLSQFSLPPALSSLLSSINKEGFESIIPSVNTISNLTKEEQATLAAQTMALKMGILPSNNPGMPGGPGGSGPTNSNFPPNSTMGMNGPPPSAQNHGPPPDFNRFPPNSGGYPPPGAGNNGFPVPPPFGGPSQNGPPSNGFYNQPPPFSGPPRNGGRGGYDGNNRGGYNDGGNRGGYDRGGYRNGGGPQRGGFHNNRDFR